MISNRIKELTNTKHRNQLQIIDGIKFKPTLFPNEKINLDVVKYPIYASLKMDGVRVIFFKGQMLSRSLKEIPNKQLQEKYQHLKDYTKKYKVILDGELYGIGMTFQSIIHYSMTEDLKNEKVPEKLKYFCFDAITDSPNTPFAKRYEFLEKLELNDVVSVKQKEVKSKDEVEAMFESALEGGFEGLILKSKTSKYKFGRVTLNSGDGYKIKPFVTFDAKIIGVEERMENLSESYTNELGHSQKHNFKDEKKETGIAACFVVNYEGQEQKVMITGDEEFRREIWKNKSNYIGKFIEFKAMTVGQKVGGLLRHPVFLRFREDKK